MLSNRTIDRRKRLIIAMDAAFGMEYLHGKNIVHFDLKCENLLVNMRDPQRPVCKVCGVGYYRWRLVMYLNVILAFLFCSFNWNFGKVLLLDGRFVDQLLPLLYLELFSCN